MSRLPYLRRDDLNEKGIEVWESVSRTRGVSAVNDDGGLVGPFNAFLHAPEVGARLSDLGAHLRFGTSVPRRTLELVIITVGAHWKAEFEWWAHARMAREAGVPDAVVDAIGAGEEPPFDNDDDRVLHALARQLVETGRIDDDTYRAAEGMVGHRGLVELVSLCGYYTLISFILNGFDVPLPPGETDQWPR